jgi:hypothetical protein
VKIAPESPRLIGRIAGVFYLLTFLTIVPISIGARVLVRGDVVATATNIVSHQTAYLVGFAGELFQLGCYIAVTALFYGLFRPVSKNVSLTAAFFSLAGCAIQGFAATFYVAPTLLLSGAPYLSAFKTDQLRSLAYTSVRLDVLGYDIGLVFFGFYCLLIGYLIVRSKFLPSILGVLMAIGGLGYLTNFAPPFAASLGPFALAPGAIAEGVLTLWLLAFGVNEQRWTEQ